jgi:hypothetical protein
MSKKSLLLISLFSLLPVLTFASTGDATFSDITTQLKAYLGGSLGLVFVFIGFLGAGAAVAGFAPMKVMFPVFGLTLALHYGPKILENIFGATGDFGPSYMHHAANFTPYDLALILASAALLVIGVHKSRSINKQEAN